MKVVEATPQPLGHEQHLEQQCQVVGQRQLMPAGDPYAFPRTPIQLSPISIAPRDCSALPRRERRECEASR